jgi:transglutaminase-like putative cysteine protease
MSSTEQATLAAAVPERVDHDELETAGRVAYRLWQRFRYEYEGTAHDLRHRLVVVPPARHGDQTLRLGTLEVSDSTADVRWRTDADGNRQALIRLARVPARLDLVVSVVAERAGTGPPVPPTAARRNPRWLSPTPLTRADARIRRMAREFATDDPAMTAERYCQVVHESIRYAPGVTDVSTSAAQALAAGAGVCQDHAHLMIALCRAAGIACRYVSGHLVGEGGTHAWVEVMAAAADGVRAVAFDPCHGRRTDRRYLTVATGRDYADVAPTSGSFHGPAQGRLHASRRLTVMAVSSEH